MIRLKVLDLEKVQIRNELKTEHRLLFARENRKQLLETKFYSLIVVD